MSKEKDSESSAGERGRGRCSEGKKAAAEEENVEESHSTIDTKSNEPESITLDLEADITQLEAPIFSIINKGPSEPMLRLNWDHKTHLIGKKVTNPLIHCCDKCEAPILIYGRMIPCKHVFCSTCAERECKTCPRCQEKVVWTEKTNLGSVFMCTFGGTRYGNTGCRRTYLSQRDLLAHINHRHVSRINNKDILNHNQGTPSSKSVRTVSSPIKPSFTHRDRRIKTRSNYDYSYKPHSSSRHMSSSQPSHKQSHHHSSTPHRIEHHPSTIESKSLGVPYSQSMQLPNQHHLVSSSPQIFPPMNRILVPNFPPPTPVSMPAIRNNLITIRTHDLNSDSSHFSASSPMAPSFPRQGFSSQFPPPSTGAFPFSVPPPSLSAINASSRSGSQFYFNTPGQSILNQSPTVQNQASMPQMLLPCQKQFSREIVTQQQFPGPQDHRWEESNQCNFF